MQTSKRTERQQVTGARLMGFDWWGHAAPTQEQSAWRASPPPKQSGGQAVPPSKNCSYQTWPASWQARLRAPWFTDMAHSSSKKWEEAWAEASPLLSSTHNIHWCTITMDLCYLRESVTRDNFYLISPRATLKKKAALSLPLLRLFDLTTSEQLYMKTFCYGASQISYFGVNG